MLLVEDSAARAVHPVTGFPGYKLLETDMIFDVDQENEIIAHMVFKQ